MKNILLLLLIACSTMLTAQTHTRRSSESAEDFINRIKPAGKELIHPTLEAVWNNKEQKVIMSFWHEFDTESEYHSTLAVCKMYVPLGSNRYKEVLIDKVGENGGAANVLSVLFYDTDGDGKRELLLLCSWDYNHYQMSGTFYGALVYDDINQQSAPNKLTQLEDIDGGKYGTNDIGEMSYPNFTNAAQLREILKARKTVRSTIVPSIAKKATADFQSVFTGKIGAKMDVIFSLKAKGGKISGFYYYENRGIDIAVEGTISGQNMVLYEKDYLGNRTGKMTGELVDDKFTGKWENLKAAKNKKSFPIELTKTSATIEPLPTNIVGVYKGGEANGILAHITKTAVGYNYRLVTPTRQLKGSLRFYRELNSESLWLEFEGIKWEANMGSLDENGEGDDTPAYGISASLDGGEISFQNYGNAMNYYVKLGECSEKYVYLNKVLPK